MFHSAATLRQKDCHRPALAQESMKLAPLLQSDLLVPSRCCIWRDIFARRGFLENFKLDFPPRHSTFCVKPRSIVKLQNSIKKGRERAKLRARKLCPRPEKEPLDKTHHSDREPLPVSARVQEVPWYGNERTRALFSSCAQLGSSVSAAMSGFSSCEIFEE